MTYKFFLICSQQIEEDCVHRGNRTYGRRCVRPTLYLLHHSRLLSFIDHIFKTKKKHYQKKQFLSENSLSQSRKCILSMKSIRRKPKPKDYIGKLSLSKHVTRNNFKERWTFDSGSFY